MKYIEQYLEEYLKIKPLGKVATIEGNLYDMSGEVVSIDGEDTGIFISHINYIDWLEKKLEGTLPKKNHANETSS